MVALFDELILGDDGKQSRILQIGALKFGPRYGLCLTERFYNQPTPAYCSGFLVGPDLIATAAHCVDAEHPLAQIRFVFGFRMINGQDSQTVFDDSQVYRGKAIVAKRFDHDDQGNGNGADWAVVLLTRKVTDHAPLPVRKTGKINDGQQVSVIGHPCGLPAKYADGAHVKANADPRFFLADLDTYGGNSGSPVFSAGLVEGILVRGGEDWYYNKEESCNNSLICPRKPYSCLGEAVTRASLFGQYVP